MKKVKKTSKKKSTKAVVKAIKQVKKTTKTKAVIQKKVVSTALPMTTYNKLKRFAKKNKISLSKALTQITLAAV